MRFILLLAIAVLILIGCERQPAQSTQQPGTGDIERSLQAAETYIDGMDFGKAEVILKRLVTVAPRHARAREAYGRLFLFRSAQAQQEGRIADAARLRGESYAQYALAVEAQPDDAGLQHAAGEVAQTAGHSEEALVHYQRAVELAPDEPRHRLFAVQLLLDTKRLDEAEAHLEHAKSEWPDEPMVHASIAALAIQRTEYDQARAAIDVARQIDPDDQALRVLEARVHRLAGNPRRAVELLVALPAAERTQPGVATELAEGYLAIDQPEPAAQCLETCLRANQADPGLTATLVGRIGMAHLSAGDVETARQWLAEGLSLNAANADIQRLRRAMDDL